MKKIVLACGLAAALMGATGCSQSSSTAPTGFEDSLSTYIGKAQGLGLAADYNNNLPEAEKAKMKKDDILRGIKQVVMTDTAQQGYLTGLSIGLSLSQQLYRYETSGIKVDRAKLYQAYAAAFASDSVSQEELREAQATFQTLAQQAQRKMQEYYTAKEAAEKEARANSPEAKENVEAGKKYVEDLKKKDPSIVTTPSGLSYKVVTEGEGEPITDQDQAVVAYKGSFINGDVFDESKEGIDFSPRAVIPGFAEALRMMKKGSHYILYIPGDLAYGIDGQPGAGIGPNQMLVFDLDVKDIKRGKQ